MAKAGTVEFVTFARRWPKSAAVSTTVTIVFVMALTATACTGEDATPIVPGATTTGPTTPHQLEPTEQMRELAEKQCLDDPTLEQGVVNAVDPADEEQILSSVVVECSDIR